MLIIMSKKKYKNIYIQATSTFNEFLFYFLYEIMRTFIREHTTQTTQDQNNVSSTDMMASTIVQCNITR